jgi:predicted permease
MTARIAGLWCDLGQGLRILLRRPAFAALVIVTLAVGIAATSSIFCVVNAVLLSALPYPEAERMVLLSGTLRQGAAAEETPVSYRDFADWQEQGAVFARLAAYSQPRSFNLTGRGSARHVSGEFVTAGYFTLLGKQAAAGRLFSAEEEAPPAGRRVAVISHDLWRESAGALAPGAVLELNGDRYEVIGVMGPGFRGLTDKAQLWLPMTTAATALSPDYLKRRGLRWLAAAGRLEPGVGVAQAQASMDGVARGLERQFPRSNAGAGVRIAPLRESFVGALRPALLTLLGGACFVLLIACANVSNLLLARALGRQREISLRSALGASRRRIVQQLLVESLLIALLACLLGLLAAHWATRLLVGASAVDFGSYVRIAVAPRVLGVILLASLLCALGFGLAPAWLGARADLGGALRQGGKGSAGARRVRSQGLLVTAEVALALTLLTGAGSMIRGFQRLRAADLGFGTADLLTLRLDLKGERYAADAAVWGLVRQIEQRLGALPGVRSVALVGPGMPTDDWYGADFNLEQRFDAATREPVFLLYHHVTPGTFATLGVPLRRGRDFQQADRAQAPGVAIVSEELARRYWPGQDPLGKRLRLRGNLPWLSVIGVAADVKHGGLRREGRPAPDVYLALLQDPPRLPPTLNALLRTAPGAAAPLVPAVRREILAIAPDLPPYDLATMAERLARQTARDRFLVLIMGLFALLALALALVGIYGLISYTVVERTREMGIRMALGARRGDVLRLIVRRGAALAAAGVGIGSLASFLLARALSGMVFGLGESEPVAFATTAVLTCAMALAASLVPARRVMKIPPTAALRVE